MTVQSVFREVSTRHPGQLTEHDVDTLIREAESEDSSGGCCSSGDEGTYQLRRIYLTHADEFALDAARLKLERFLGIHGHRPGSDNLLDPIRRPGEVGGKVLVEGKANHRTWHCDWFPMAARADAPGINLWARGGVCHKYDHVTRAKSRAYEEQHYSSGVSWAGHCDKASRVCCLLEQPVRSVNYGEVEFTPHDIQGLLVMVSDDLAAQEPIFGQRNNGRAGDDPSEPLPHKLYPKLKQWLEENVPFVMDIDSGLQVWNYAFDKGTIQEFSSPQRGMAAVEARNGGTVKYQTWDLHGTGYDEQTRHYMSWMEYVDGKLVASGWFGDPNDTKRNPDFVWKPVPNGDLRRKDNWPTQCSYNPEIDPRLVYDIYTRSIR